MCVSACALAGPEDVSASYVYLDKVFHSGFWNGSNLPRTDLRLVRFLDTCIFNLLQFGHSPLLHPRATAWSFYYVWPSNVFKKKERNETNVKTKKQNRSRMHLVPRWIVTVSEPHRGKAVANKQCHWILSYTSKMIDYYLSLKYSMKYIM